MRLAWNSSSDSVEDSVEGQRRLGRRATASSDSVEGQRRLGVSVRAYSAYLCGSAGESIDYITAKFNAFVMLLLRKRPININLTISGMFHQQLIFRYRVELKKQKVVRLKL